MKLNNNLQIIFVLLVAGSLWFLSRAGTETVNIRITDQGFVPESISMKRGSRIEFVNETKLETWPASDLHPTHGVYPEFDPQEPISPGSSWTFTFKKTGEWRYHDHLKPNRRGTIKVE